jgi:hypothetical protein
MLIAERLACATFAEGAPSEVRGGVPRSERPDFAVTAEVIGNRGLDSRAMTFQLHL